VVILRQYRFAVERRILRVPCRPPWKAAKTLWFDQRELAKKPASAAAAGTSLF